MGLLDGDLAQIIGDALETAEITLPATLTKITPGTRNPAAITSGTNSTSTDYPCRAIPASTAPFLISGTLIKDVNRVIRIIGASLPAGITPEPTDQVTMQGSISRIVNNDGGKNAVIRDAASATYLCQCR